MINIVQGWTMPIDYILKADGVVVDLTGMQVELKLRDLRNRAVTPAGTLSVVDAVAGQVAYSPAAGELLASLSPYSARFEVTDGSGKVVFFPNALAETWTVRAD